MRQRYEFYHNPNFGSGPSNNRGNNDYLLQRYFLHSDLHLGAHLRFFGQFMSSLEHGRIGGPRPEVDRNVFDAHQGFMDIVIPFTEGMSAIWRLGRQEFEYGSGRFISAREVPNTRRSFDAARVLFRVDKWAIDGFWGKPVRNRVRAFDDDPDPNKSLWGVYAIRRHSLLPDGHTDLSITSVLRTSKACLLRVPHTKCVIRLAPGCGDSHCHGNTTLN
ncbi:MAG: alginate export family protein [Nitrosomonas sp.]|nr:alginate export family protein [Nitrosomonas sp.]MCW5606867.1 alginate export family protein [Nitrosomonas sp.]